MTQDEITPSSGCQRTGGLDISHHRIVAAVIIIVTCSLLYISGSRQNYIVCDMECGEAIIAKEQSNQFVKHGVHFGLIENENTFEEPILYTHNVNIGDFFLIALETFGVHSYRAMVAGTLIVHALGLLYVYLTMLFFSESSLAALTILAVFSSVYWGYGAFALNPLRVWHALAFFMLAYHTARWATRTRLFTFDIVGVTVGALIAFGCGYDFWVICAGLAASLIISRGLKSWNFRLTGFRLFQIAGAFAFPFLLRQLQIIYALGADYWWKDIIFSLAIKVPGASKIVTIPPLADIDAFYKARHVMRPPASPTNNWYEIIDTAKHMIEVITIPRWGALTLVIFVGVVLLASMIRLRLMPYRWRPRPAIAALSGDFLLPATTGVLVGLAIFAPFSLHVYLKHEFPLIAFLLLPSRGLFIYWLISSLMQNRRRSRGWLSGLALFFVFSDSVIVHVNASMNSVYLNFGFLNFVNEHQNAKILISSYDPSPVYDQTVGLDRQGIQRRQPFQAAATLQELRADIAHGFQDLPEYWIYQPNEPHVMFDSQHPTCRWQDWLLAGVRLFSPARLTTPPTLDQPWLTPSSPGPGSIISFGGNLTGVRPADELSLDLKPPLEATGKPSYNCIYGSVVAWASVIKSENVDTAIKLILHQPDGGEIDLHDFPLTITDKPNPTSALGPFASNADLTIPALISTAPELKIVERSSVGLGYIIFQLPQSAAAEGPEGKLQ